MMNGYEKAKREQELVNLHGDLTERLKECEEALQELEDPEGERKDSPLLIGGTYIFTSNGGGTLTKI